jgi:Uma2 family endonuclease
VTFAPSTLARVKTVVLGPRPAELEELIERRRRLGQDLYDEIWEGSYHMAPAPHSDHGHLDAELAAILAQLAKAAGMTSSGPLDIGRPDDYRVPDRAVLRERQHATYLPTAAVVVEIVSPDDETFEKLPFYADHGVEEVLTVEGQERRVRIFSLEGSSYVETGRSALLGITAAELAERIDW